MKISLEANQLFQLGLAAQNHGDLLSAQQHYLKVISICPEYPDTYLNLGNIKAMQNDFDAAIELYDMSIMVDPKYPLAYFNKGLTLGRMNKFDESISTLLQLEEIEDIEPAMLSNAYFNCGYLCYSSGKLDQALSFNYKSLELNWGNQDSSHNMEVYLSEYQDSVFGDINHKFLMPSKSRIRFIDEFFLKICKSISDNLGINAIGISYHKLEVSHFNSPSARLLGIAIVDNNTTLGFSSDHILSLLEEGKTLFLNSIAIPIDRENDVLETKKPVHEVVDYMKKTFSLNVFAEDTIPFDSFLICKNLKWISSTTSKL